MWGARKEGAEKGEPISEIDVHLVVPVNDNSKSFSIHVRWSMPRGQKLILSEILQPRKEKTQDVVLILVRFGHCPLFWPIQAPQCAIFRGLGYAVVPHVMHIIHTIFTVEEVHQPILGNQVFQTGRHDADSETRSAYVTGELTCTTSCK